MGKNVCGSKNITMDHLWEEAQKLVQSLSHRLQTIWDNSSPESLKITALLGIAALLFGYYRTRQNQGRGPGDGQSGSEQNSTGQGSRNTGASKTDASPSSLNVESFGPPKSCSCSPLRLRLSNVKTVTISVPGVLLGEKTPLEVEEGASVIDEALSLVKEMSSFTQVYLIAQVSSDIGDVVVRGALEATGITADHSIPAHRLLSCETVQGKVAIVRQIEPDIHIDADYATIHELQRFVPRQLYIFEEGITAASTPTPKLTCASSLAEALNAFA